MVIRLILHFSINDQDGKTEQIIADFPAFSNDGNSVVQRHLPVLKAQIHRWQKNI